ncbi:hypothetical protein NE237_021312 [Protea cynaroides]|uniref:Uncharacterized protein n=1 Tax=Protea cynaroides TaxID=273540 RepID=A0A9Q0H7R4_9MAGN|nr:hypothetical protein NE237_021312 [Protea cynaroides]
MRFTQEKLDAARRASIGRGRGRGASGSSAPRALLARIRAWKIEEAPTCPLKRTTAGCSELIRPADSLFIREGQGSPTPPSDPPVRHNRGKGLMAACLSIDLTGVELISSPLHPPSTLISIPNLNAEAVEEFKESPELRQIILNASLPTYYQGAQVVRYFVSNRVANVDFSKCEVMLSTDAEDGEVVADILEM